jgi:O-antigen/teichoic acid export membrane protein
LLLQGGLRQTLSVHIQELVRDGRKEELRKVVRSIIEYSLIVGSLVAMGTVFVAQDIFAILFGNSSWHANEISRLWQVCCIYSMVVLAACLGGLLVTILIATKSFRLCLLVETVRLGSFAAFACLSFWFDIYGLAAAQVLQQILGSGLVLILICCFLERKPRWANWVRCTRITMVLAPAAAGLWLGRTVADWLAPTSFQLAGAWLRLGAVSLIALPGLGITLWLGEGMEIAPLYQIGSVVRKRLGLSPH